MLVNHIEPEVLPGTGLILFDESQLTRRKNGVVTLSSLEQYVQFQGILRGFAESFVQYLLNSEIVPKAIVNYDLFRVEYPFQNNQGKNSNVKDQFMGFPVIGLVSNVIQSIDFYTESRGRDLLVSIHGANALNVFYDNLKNIESLLGESAMEIKPFQALFETNSKRYVFKFIPEPVSPRSTSQTPMADLRPPISYTSDYKSPA